MNATDVIGYSADADIYCPACAALIYDRVIDGVLRTVADEREAFTALDFEGNAVHPIFGSDELEPDDACARCHERLIESDRIVTSGPAHLSSANHPSRA
jgi:hypothetical protein